MDSRNREAGQHITIAAFWCFISAIGAGWIEPSPTMAVLASFMALVYAYRMFAALLRSPTAQLSPSTAQIDRERIVTE